jgi:hypothetical protein
VPVAALNKIRVLKIWWPPIHRINLGQYSFMLMEIDPWPKPKNAELFDPHSD